MPAHFPVVITWLLAGALLETAGGQPALPSEQPAPATQADQPPPPKPDKPPPSDADDAKAAQEETPKYEEQVVVSASKVEQALVNAPATVTLIDSRAITASPATNYGDLLRAVPGLNVSQTSARDVNLTSRAATVTLSTSQLALVDGRTIYQDFFGFVAWDLLPMSPAELSRLRQPGHAPAEARRARLVTSIKVTNLGNAEIQQHVFGDITRRQIVGELRVGF